MKPSPIVRPDARNAINRQLGEELATCLAELREDAALRAVIITGAGTAKLACLTSRLGARRLVSSACAVLLSRPLCPVPPSRRCLQCRSGLEGKPTPSQTAENYAPTLVLICRSRGTEIGNLELISSAISLWHHYCAYGPCRTRCLRTRRS